MAQTTVASGSNLAVTQFSAALTSQIIRAPGNLNSLTGKAPTQKEAEAQIKQQTNAGSPFIRVADLNTDPKGDQVTVDAFNIVGGKPIMGDRNAEGLGKKLVSSSFQVKIDLATFNVDAGGKMSQQRTRHNLLTMAKAESLAYFPRLVWQRAIVHSAGARGLQAGTSWDVPLQADTDFAEVMINPVKCPTYNRHLVVNGTGFVRGGQQLGSIATTDKWKLSCLDNLALFLENAETQLPPIRMDGDEQAYDAPLKGVLWLSPSSYNDLVTDMTSGSNLRFFQANIEQRQKYAKDTALFRGEAGIWRGIVVKKMNHSIFHNASSGVQFISLTNRLTETESTATVNAAIGATNQVERAIFMGAQALARAEGSSNSGLQAGIIENAYNGGRNFEYLTEFMGGEAKFRFRFPNENGDAEPTDNGIYVIDACTAKTA